MKFDWKQPGYITSAIAHLALLLAALLAFSDTKKFEDAQESIAVEVISEAQLNDVPKGDKAAKDIKPKPKVDKVSEAEVQKPTPPTPLAKVDVPTPLPPLKPQIDPGQDPVPEAKPVPTPPVKPVEPPKPEIKPDPPKPEPRPAPEPQEPKQEPKPEPKPEPVKTLPTPPIPKPVTRPQPDEPNPEAEVVRPAPPKTQDLAKLIEKTAPPEPPKPKVRPRDKTPAAEAPDKDALKQQIDAAAEKAKLDQKLADDSAKEKAILDKAVKDKAAKDAAAKQAALDKAADAAQEKADREKADQDKAAKDKADKDKAAKAMADKSAAEKAAALLKPKAGDTADAPKKDVLGDISKFLSKDKPQNTGSTGKVASAEPAAGTATASAAKMSPNLKAQLNGWLKDKYHACWSLPITLPTGSKYVPKIQVTFNSDGSLAGAPRLANPPADPAFNSLAASAKAAVMNPDCNPLKIPPHFQAFFNEWKDSTISFDPEDQ